LWRSSRRTPPCIANGTVYERLPGKTQPVRDPLILERLYSRGEEAKRNAEARADRAAMTLLKDGLEGDAGEFGTGLIPEGRNVEEPEEGKTPGERKANARRKDEQHVRFAIGVAATGNPADIAARLFNQDFADEVREQLRARSPFPGALTPPADVPIWSQDSIMWRYQLIGPVNPILLVRASWDGSVAAGEKIATDDVYVDHFASTRMQPAWEMADRLVQRLRGFGDVYVTAVVAGGRFSRWSADDNDLEPTYVVLKRGPLLPGVDDERVASLSRELERALGMPTPEPEPPN
jgi:hypothetical protein